VNGQPPGVAPDLSEWILGSNISSSGEEKQEKSETEEPPFDLLAVGFQELDLSTEGMIYASSASVLKAQAWKEVLQDILASTGVPYQVVSDANTHFVTS
jgi:phosphatidylinositol-bisphosphatase